MLGNDCSPFYPWLLVRALRWNQFFAFLEFLWVRTQTGTKKLICITTSHRTSDALRQGLTNLRDHSYRWVYIVVFVEAMAHACSGFFHGLVQLMDSRYLCVWMDEFTVLINSTSGLTLRFMLWLTSWTFAYCASTYCSSFRCTDWQDHNCPG